MVRMHIDVANAIRYARLRQNASRFSHCMCAVEVGRVGLDIGASISQCDIICRHMCDNLSNRIYVRPYAQSIKIQADRF